MHIRTEQAAPVQQSNGLWACKWVTYIGQPGNERINNITQSAAVWQDEDSALAAGNRALDTLEHTDCWPNLCEKW